MQPRSFAWIGVSLATCLGSCGSSDAREPELAMEAPTADALSLSPLADGAQFTSAITHPYLPLSKVRIARFSGDDERVVCEVLERVESIAGVECAVLAENEFEDDELVEISYNYFAQDEGGNVWYFGERVDDYEDGKVVGHGGAWLVGETTSEPCLFMPARLAVGASFKRENSPPVAEEWNEVEALDAVLRVPAGEFRDVVVVKEADKQGRWKERKYYARGVGLISENKKLDLVSFQ